MMAMRMRARVGACAYDGGAHHACINALVVLSKTLLFIAEMRVQLPSEACV